jgi:hypothetical protein
VKGGLARESLRIQTVCVKTVTYPVRFERAEYEKLQAEAKRRRKTLAGLLRDLVAYGLPALPPLPESQDTSAVAELWESLGPSPEVDYDKLPRGR